MPTPSDWTEQLSREAILRSLGFRPPHQTHFRLSVTDVLGVPASVFAHAMSKVDNVPDTAMWQSLGRLYFKENRVGFGLLYLYNSGLCLSWNSVFSGIGE